MILSQDLKVNNYYISPNLEIVYLTRVNVGQLVISYDSWEDRGDGSGWIRFTNQSVNVGVNLKLEKFYASPTARCPADVPTLTEEPKTPAMARLCLTCNKELSAYLDAWYGNDPDGKASLRCYRCNQGR
jgi:hypothetical protein